MDTSIILGSFEYLNPPATFFYTPNILLDQQWSQIDQISASQSDKPQFWHLVGLVCEAVLEVVCVSGLGFIASKRGLFPAKVQKDVANLNIYFFTPCLIFSKLSSQLTAEKFKDLWIIVVILFVQTSVSWATAQGASRLFKINKKPHRNFVTAMAVFGNSNSLPLSLVISLSHTIKGLHWDKQPGDNDNEVAARGILYLLIFSQLGQAVRWSWGMNTLLRPLSEYTPAERDEIPRDEEEHEPYRDDESETESGNSRPSSSQGSTSISSTSSATQAQIKTDDFGNATGGSETPQNGDLHQRMSHLKVPGNDSHPQQRVSPLVSAAHSVVEFSQHATEEANSWTARTWTHIKEVASHAWSTTTSTVSDVSTSLFTSLPSPIQWLLRLLWRWTAFFVSFIWSCLNVPLMAIIVAVLVGSVPQLKAFFYTRGTFVNNTVTSAVNQLAGVAVPLILFVLGGNLNKSTLPGEDLDNPAYRREKRRMLFCAIACRMVFPLIIMTPLLALLAKYAPISILDDPIFLIVCFLLTGAPSALQLAQICQVNDVFVPVISDLLMYSYVVLIFPSTIVLVMLALEVVKWASVG